MSHSISAFQASLQGEFASVKEFGACKIQQRHNGVSKRKWGMLSLTSN